MSAPTVPQAIDADQANKEVPIREDLSAAAHQTVYAYRYETSSGLTFGYHAGRWGGFSIAAGTVTLTGSTTNYIVVNRSTGAVSVSTATTNWNDSTAYARVYRVTTDGSGVTNLYGSDFDYRAGPGGVHGSQASAGAGTELKGLTFTSDTGSTADSDPGAGLFKWNNATQGSATKLFIDEASADAVNLDTLFAALGDTGKIFIQQSTDADRWQLWGWTAAPTDDTGYWDFPVTLLAKSASDIANGVECYFDFDSEGEGTTASALQGNGLDVDAAGFRGIPQNAQTGNYTTVAADAGKHLYHASGAGAGDTYTIDSNANVAYEIGTAITFINDAADAVSIAITSDTLALAGTGTTGTRTLAQYGVATAIKVTSTRWIISGTGLT